MSPFYDFEPLDVNSEPVSMSKFKGKVVLVVNVASKCGLVLQYKELEALYTKYKDEGFVILAFPCNQFGAQEPYTGQEIVQFCQARYNVTFPIMHKVEVNGSGAIPLYVWLKNEKHGFMGFKGVKWNFEKFLIDRDGQVVDRYSCSTTPLEFESKIKECLQQRSTEN